jgi:hypothetical protein
MMTDMPKRIAALPRTDAGVPVPFFVAYVQGKPDFRIADQRKFAVAVRQRRCWICGEPLGQRLCFVVGPMGAFNRISSEPPSHRSCALYALQICPYLARPHAVRRETNKPNCIAPAGAMFTENPGVNIAWTTRGYWFGGNMLFEMDEPETLQWWTQKRLATRAEALAALRASIDKVKPLAYRAEDKAMFAAAVEIALARLPA